MTENEKPLTFEEALAQLEGIVNQLERGEVSLDDAVAAYERGSALRKQCQDRLDEARLKVEKIRAARASSTPEGTAPFDADDA
ncbi:MAG: exodeoxyribonuclease VII small subunit [Candidatus Puniceispirillales bacterium]